MGRAIEFLNPAASEKGGLDRRRGGTFPHEVIRIVEECRGFSSRHADSLPEKKARLKRVSLSLFRLLGDESIGTFKKGQSLVMHMGAPLRLQPHHDSKTWAMIGEVMRFDVLYHFSNGPIHLIETKRLDLPASATPGEIYQWFFIDDKELHLLNFSTMSLNPQRRVFEEGAVTFNLNSCQGRILEKDLDLMRNDKVSISITQLLESGLRKKSSHG